MSGIVKSWTMLIIPLNSGHWFVVLIHKPISAVGRVDDSDDESGSESIGESQVTLESESEEMDIAKQTYVRSSNSPPSH